MKGFLLKNTDQSNYRQAAVKIIYRIALLFFKLSDKQTIEDFNPVFQTVGITNVIT